MPTLAYHSPRMPGESRPPLDRGTRRSLLLAAAFPLTPLPSAAAIVYGVAAAQRHFRARNRSFGLACVGILAGVLGLAIWVWLPYELIRTRRMAAERQCMSQLRELGRTLYAYCADHKGQLPDSLADLVESSTVPLDPKALVCPASDDVASSASAFRLTVSQPFIPGHVSYVYLGKGRVIRRLTPDMIIAFEPAGHHGDGVVALCADGTVRNLDPALAVKLIQKTLDRDR